jgi:hypothetical protein
MAINDKLNYDHTYNCDKTLEGEDKLITYNHLDQVKIYNFETKEWKYLLIYEADYGCRAGPGRLLGAAFISISSTIYILGGSS